MEFSALAETALYNEVILRVETRFGKLWNSMLRLFDTHMHLDDEQFSGIRDEIVQRAADAGVIGIVAVGTCLCSSQQAVQLAQRYEIVHAAIGIQPNYTQEAGESDWRELEQLATHPAVVAIGETGLDHYWQMAPLDLQRDYLARHIDLATARDMPLVIHMREPKSDATPVSDVSCAEDILQSLIAGEASSGIMHSYTGDRSMATEFIERGMHISFAGMVTYKKSHDLRNVAQQIPDGRLLIETDAPYLSPHPRRGQRPNEPALVRCTAECLAKVRGMTLEQLAELTTRNAMEVFGLAANP